MKLNKPLNLNFIFKKLKKNINCHKNFSKDFINLEKELINYIKENISNHYKTFKILNIPVKLKNFKFGKLALVNIMGLDEMIIFDFYKRKRKIYNNVCDIGANIGLHTLLLKKLKYKNIVSYEPDKDHIKTSLNFFKKNNVVSRIKNFAISNKSGKIRFTKILDNTTGSHIEGLKKKVYGKIKIMDVKTLPINSFIDKFDFIKIDCEGSEKLIFKSTPNDSWKTTDAIVEITDKESRLCIWKKFKNSDINIYSQKTRWKKCKKLTDLPLSHKEGSIFISHNSKFF